MTDTPILYLDADDEITSAAARIRDTDAERMALVLPYGSRLATSRINFRLLAREAADRGKIIEIVAADASARALAMTAGLAVHPSVSAFEAGATAATAPSAATEAVPTPVATSADAPTSAILVPKAGSTPVPVVGRARPPMRPRTAAGIAIALLVVLVILGLAAFTVLPSATITLSPWSETIGPLTADIVADPTATVADPTTLTVPATRLTFPLAVLQTFQATGSNVTETNATGSVTFQNCDTGGNVTIPAGARVATANGIGFITQSKVMIRRALVFPFSCRTGSVSVVAQSPGTDGNVPAGAITKIPPGYDPIVLTVTNQNPTTGGTHTDLPQITQGDVDGAIATLTAALSTSLDQQIATATNVPPGTTLYLGTKQLGTATPTIDPTTLVGLMQASFDLGLNAQGTVLGVDSSAVKAIAKQRLQAQLKPGWTLDPASISIDAGNPSVVGSVVTFHASMTGTETPTIDQQALLSQLEGLGAPEARAKLADLGQADLQLWPGWVTTIPSNASRVTLTIGSPVPLPSPTP
ncbi:MAG TPA: baseplate J/gp47 family protein [Candidatus Limnocylindrales bacterium]|nr:baseplate J/gp47 family protein [Candidatus Limnocylindrales bacterium]